jgi:hypothetical protein
MILRTHNLLHTQIALIQSNNFYTIGFKIILLFCNISKLIISMVPYTRDMYYESQAKAASIESGKHGRRSFF